jgi:predicted HTH domain antitoxin
MSAAAFTFPEELLTSARMTLDDVRLELAITLFRLDRLSMGKSAEVAGLPVGTFQNHLAARQIGPHYDVADALADARTLAALPR